MGFPREKYTSEWLCDPIDWQKETRETPKGKKKRKKRKSKRFMARNRQREMEEEEVPFGRNIVSPCETFFLLIQLFETLLPSVFHPTFVCLLLISLSFFIVPFSIALSISPGSSKRARDVKGIIRVEENGPTHCSYLFPEP